jgi:hypothetical protein
MCPSVPARDCMKRSKAGEDTGSETLGPGKDCGNQVLAFFHGKSGGMWHSERRIQHGLASVMLV